MKPTPWTVRQLAPFQFIIARQVFPSKNRQALAAAWAAIRRKAFEPLAPAWEPLTFHGHVIYWDTKERAQDALDGLAMARVLVEEPIQNSPQLRVWRFRDGDGLPTIETL